MEQNEKQNAVTPEAQEKKKEASSIFRRKAIDRITSPEQLNDYIRVASPRMWLVLVAVVVFLAGAFVWGVFGRIESSVYCVLIADEAGDCTLYFPQKKTALLELGDIVTIDDVETTVSAISSEPFAVTESFPEYARSVGGFALGEWICSADVEAKNILPKGIYPAVILEESISPLSLLTETN